jgi:hypothetical protein
MLTIGKERAASLGILNVIEFREGDVDLFLHSRSMTFIIYYAEITKCLS